MVIGLVVVSRKWKKVLEVGLMEPYYDMMSKPGLSSSLIKDCRYLHGGEQRGFLQVATVEVAAQEDVSIRYCELELFVPIHQL